MDELQIIEVNENSSPAFSDSFSAQLNGPMTPNPTQNNLAVPNKSASQFSYNTLACDKTVIRQFREYLANQDKFDFCSELDLSQSDDELIDHICQFMDVSKTDELLADFLIRYKVGGVHGDQDPKLATFECRWASIKRQFSLRGLTVKKNNFPNTYTSLKDRRQTLSQMEKNIKARKETGKSFVVPNIQKDRNDLGQFLSQYYKMDPNVLSCTVQFFIMRILRLITVEDLEMLKFGDFIYQRDERGHEYFRLSDKLINFLRDYKKLNLTAITPILKPPFPCPVEVLKYYFFRQDNKLRENEAAFNNVGFFVQPKPLDRLVVDDVWYLTTYFKPKSTLSNVFIRLRQTGQNMSVYPLKLEGRYTHADLDQLFPNYTAGTEVKIVNGLPANNITSHQLDSSLPLTNIISNIENGLTNGLQNGKRELIPSPQLPQSPQKKPRLVPEQTQIGLNQQTQPSLPKTPVSQTVSSNKNYADLITWFTSQIDDLKSENNSLRAENRNLTEINCHLRIENEKLKFQVPS